MKKNKILEISDSFNMKEKKENKESILYKKVSEDIEKSHQDIMDMIRSDKVINKFYKKLDFKDKVAFVLLLDDLRKQWKDIYFISKVISKYPKKMFSLLEIKYDDVKKLLVLEKKYKENKEIIKENKEIIKENNEIAEILEKQKKEIKSRINQKLKKAPEFEKPIKDQSKQISEKYGISQDEAFIYVFNKFYQENQQFANKIWDIPSQYKWLIESITKKVEEQIKVSEKVEQISWAKQWISAFSEKSVYDNDLKSKVEGVNIEKLDFNQKLKIFNNLFDIYKSDIQKDLVKYNLNIEKVEKYLNWEKLSDQETEKVNQVFIRYLETFNKEFENTFLKEYKKKAMEKYVKETLDLFYQITGWEGIEYKSVDIKSDWQININFKYKNTPLYMRIDKEGNIIMENYTYFSQGLYKLWEEKVNDFFEFVGIKQIMEGVENMSAEEFLIFWKEWKNKLDSFIEDKLDKFYQENDRLWNKNLMKAEMNYELTRQDISYSFIKFYVPPEIRQKYLTWNFEITQEKDKDFYNFLKTIDYSLRFQKGSEEILEKVLTSRQFRCVLDDLSYQEDSISTYSFLRELKLISSEWSFNLERFNKFVNLLEKSAWNAKALNLLNWLFPINWYEWEVTSDGKVKLVKQELDLDFSDVIEKEKVSV